MLLIRSETSSPTRRVTTSAPGVDRRDDRETKIRPCPDRQTSSRIRTHRTQREETSRSQQIGGTTTAGLPARSGEVGHHVAVLRTRRVVEGAGPPRALNPPTSPVGSPPPPLAPHLLGGCAAPDGGFPPLALPQGGATGPC